MVAGSAILVAVVLAACGSSNVVTSPTASAAVAITGPSASPDPSPSPSASPTPTPSPSPAATPSPTPTPTPVPPLALNHCAGKTGGSSTDAFNSTNKYFSGYLDFSTTNTVTCVEANWVQPAITCLLNDNTSDMSIYVGIGGTDGKGTSVPHERFEKAATEAYCVNGVPNYIAWTDAREPKGGFTMAPFRVSAHDQIWRRSGAPAIPSR